MALDCAEKTDARDRVLSPPTPKATVTAPQLGRGMRANPKVFGI